MVTARYLAGVVAMLGAMSLASGAQAQEADGDGSIDCIAIATVWSGGSDDIAHIATIPVPQSYRDMYLGDICTRFSLVTTSLIDWHLAFGNEASTTAAIAFFEADSMGGKPVIADLAPPLKAARRDAQPDIVAAAALFHQEDGWARGRAFYNKSKAIDRLQSVINTVNTYDFLASQYLRAAEFYGSPTLFARARLYARPVLDLLPTLRALGSADAKANLDHGSPLTGEDSRDLVPGNLEVSMAIVSAGFSRDPKDLATAKAVLDSYYVPLYKVAADEAFNHSDEFCDIGDETNLADYSTACQNGNFTANASAWWRYRAQLDLLLGTDKEALPQSVGTAIRLTGGNGAEYNKSAQRGLRSSDAANDPIIALHLASADALVRSARVKPGESSEKSRDTALQSLDAALEELVEAEPLAPASRTPGRFRQIATRFLAIQAESAALGAPEHDSAIDRKAAYFRAVLAALDGIATAGASRR
jgi:hypothetical protein